MLKQYVQLDLRIVLIVIILVECSYQWILQNHFITDQVVYQSFITELTDEQFAKGQQKANVLSWLFFLFTPITVLFSVLAAAWCLNLGNLLLEKPNQFRTIFAITSRAYIVFSVARIVALILYANYGIETVLDLQKVPTLSLYDLWPKDAIPQGLSYPMKLVNLYQLAFILGLTIGFSDVTQTSVRQCFTFVLKTYGLGLFLWILLAVFLANI
ncbi:MAG: hypothetical protein AAGH79_11290 [Bacteroidota bacterium]